MTVAAPAELALWLDGVRAWTDRELERWLPSEEEHPERLHRAMRYAVLGGGKRLRPALVRLVCDGLGGRDGAARLPAVAVELVHTYSLVHDDLPCMDDDELRRGRPTCHVAFDEATAVLVGDALLTLAFEVLAAVPGDGAVAAAGVLAGAAGSRGMVGGQALDLSLESRPEGALGELEDAHDRKTGALFSAAAELGAIAAGAGPRARSLAAELGLALGRTFQVTDDLLDVTGDAATLGKTPGKDAALERVTIVGALGLDGARTRARALADAAIEAGRALGAGVEARATPLVRFVLERTA